MTDRGPARECLPGGVSGPRCEVDVELDLNLVAQLERSQQRRIRTDPPPGLHDDRRPVRVARSQLAHDGDRLGDTDDGEVTVDAERLLCPADLSRYKRDRRVLPGVEDLAAKRKDRLARPIAALRE